MRCFFLLFLLVPFLSFAAGTDLPDHDDRCEYECRIEPQQGVENSWVVVCDYHDCNTDEQEFMSQDACSNLVSQIEDLLDRLETDLEAVDNEVGDVDISLEEFQHNLQNYQDYVLTLADTPDEYEQVVGIWGLFLTNIETNRMQIGEARGQIDMMLGNVMSARDSVDNYDCSGTCSATTAPTNGQGSASCPCQSELSDIMNLISTGNQTREKLEDIQKEIRTELRLLRDTATNILDAVDWIKKRLEAPDDRMWGEIFDLYRSTFGTNGLLTKASLNLEEIFYDIRQLIRGDVSTPLNLTTEGAIGLNGLVFQMGQFALGQSLSLQMDYMLLCLTNVMANYYRQFNILTGSGHVFDSSFVPPSAKYVNLFNAFTNSTLSPRSRYLYLGQSNFSGVTNWFQRMELYQQAALGWFDNLKDSYFERNQEEETQDSLTHNLEYTTNNLHVVTEVSSNVFLSAESSIRSIVDGFGSVEIVAELPSQIIIFPETDIGSFGTLPEIVFKPSDIQEYCDMARNFTTLVWRLMIWVLYILVVVGVSRLLFLVVLFIIHFIQNL